MNYRNKRKAKIKNAIILSVVGICVLALTLSITWLVYINSQNYITVGVDTIECEAEGNASYDVILIEDILFGGVSR